MISIVIPVGPKPNHQRWLGESIQSVRDQTVPAGEILIIDDGAMLDPADFDPDIRFWRTPWVSGAVHACNYGVALAQHPLIVLLPSDDILRPWCLQDCMKAWKHHKDPLGYYWFAVEYTTGWSQAIASGPAMITKALWEHTGGWPLEATIGAGDHIFISAMYAARGRGGRVFQVESAQPPYLYRVHPDQIQNTQNVAYGSVIGLVRDVLAAEWVERWK